MHGDVQNIHFAFLRLILDRPQHLHGGRID